MKINDELSRRLWVTVLTPNLFIHIANIKDEDGEHIEDEKSVSDFFEHVENTILYSDVIALSNVWNDLSESKQVSVAIKMCGEYHASRFMIMMDYISKEG